MKLILLSKIKPVVTGSLCLAIASLTLGVIPGVFSDLNTVQAQTPQKIEPQVGPPIFTTSSPAAIALAQHLTSVKARFFGAWWCNHCAHQKELLGREAMTHITYVECDLRGLNPQRDLCIASRVPGFPTWEIKGNRYTGVQTLEQLADVSGYTGDRKF